ncbi:MAG: erythromycin esterase family protein [Actinoplanes sp.]
MRMMRHWTGPHRNDRSRHMGEDLLDLMDQDPDVRKVVVWAHNRHTKHSPSACATGNRIRSWPSG